MKWTKIGRTVSAEGTTGIYELDGTDVKVESRKRHIPHAAAHLGYGGKTYWDHTTYWVLKDGKALKECYSLKDAKEYGESVAYGEADL